MREGRGGAVAAVTFGILAAVTWKKGGLNPFRWRRPARKRVSFSDADNSVIEVSLDLTDDERRALNWSPAELRQLSRARAMDGWLEEWGS